VAIPLRGAWTGNRGILHRGTEIVRFHAHEHWITCALHFKDRWHEQWRPHHFTWLYFHDEAVSFAAGHRPCAECRRADYNAYRAAWAAGLATELPSAKAIDHRLHGERIVRGTHRRVTHPVQWTELPEGAFVLFEQRFAVMVDGGLTTWSEAGYGERLRRPLRGRAAVLTPPATLAVLRSGYPVQIDDTARAVSDRPTAGRSGRPA
jgi:hypothetical protein